MEKKEKLTWLATQGAPLDFEKIEKTYGKEFAGGLRIIYNTARKIIHNKKQRRLKRQATSESNKQHKRKKNNLT